MLSYKTTINLLLVLLSSIVFAQDWQWERYEGDYRNPTGFPQGFNAIGDFDGDGFDELLSISMNGTTVFSYDNQSELPRWNQIECQWIGDLVTCANFNTFDLDGEPGDELIILEQNWPGTQSCFKLVSTDPWTFEQHDELIESELPMDLLLEGSEALISIVVADFDGDSRIEAAFSHHVLGFTSAIGLYERDEDNTWHYDFAVNSQPWAWPWMFKGDFDHDGDVDFGACAPFIDTPHFIAMMENTGNGLAEPVQVHNHLGGIGGDIDHDGEWESIKFNQPGPWNHRIIEIIEWEDIGVIRDSMDMVAFSGTVFGNVTVNSESVVCGYFPWAVYPEAQAFEAYAEQTFWKFYSESGWQALDLGIDINDGKTLSFGWGDLNNDGLNDMLREVQRFYIEVDTVTYVEWEIRLNNGNQTQDDFSVQTSTLASFTNNPDTLFSNLQLSDFDQDGHADLFALAQPTEGTTTYVLIYRTDPDRGFFLESAWSLGLPQNVEKFYCRDIDNDGLPELFTFIDEWSVYFFRNGHWQDYSHILPDFESEELGFADFDNDDDIDIFTDDDVWISLSPSPTPEDIIPHPSAFSLSCYPNPFNPTTTLRFSLPDAGKISLDIFNIRGQLVETLLNQPMTAGEHTVQFNGSALPSGVYFARLQTIEQITTQKLLLLK